MIISDKYRFIFIHIPKCAGGFIRRKLDPFDDYKGFFGANAPTNLSHGIYMHIPLYKLKEFYPKEFEKIVSYDSFAILRDPYERFSSSIAQRLKEFKNKPFHRLSSNEIHSEVDEVLRYLENQDEIDDYSYIHFTPQSQFVYFNDELLVKNLYTLNSLDIMLLHIKRIIGDRKLIEVEDKTINLTDVYRNEYLRKIFESLRPLLSNTILPMIPEKFKIMIRKSLYYPKKYTNINVFNSREVRNFIGKYYHDDIELFNTLKFNEDKGK